MSSACYWYSLYTFLYYQRHWAGAHRCCLLGTGRRGAVISSVPKSSSLLTLHLLVAFDAFWILLGGFDGQREFVSPKNSAKQRPFAKKTEWHRKIYFCTVYVLWCSVHLSSVWGEHDKETRDSLETLCRRRCSMNRTGCHNNLVNSWATWRSSWITDLILTFQHLPARMFGMIQDIEWYR